MPVQVNANYSANYEKFVDFANKAYAKNAEDTVARFTGMPKGDYKGLFASFARSAEMKTANDQVRDLFRRTIADMFGGERNIPDIVRDNMKLEDFNKGKPLTARRINLVRIAIDTVAGGKFADPASVGKATGMGYVASELPKLARVANIYQQATGCTDAEAEAAALDPNSKARRLYDYGGRFVKNADSFKAGLALMDKFANWYENLMGDREAKTRDTPTKANLNFASCTDAAKTGVEKFVFEEISVNDQIPLDAENPEDLFGMANNPAMQFAGRGYATSLSNSLAQMQPEKRKLIYAVFNALDPLPDASSGGKRDKVDYSLLVAARVMKNYDAVAALQKSGKLDRANLVPILYSDVEASPESTNSELSSAIRQRLATNPMTMGQIMFLAENSGATFDEAEAALASGTRLENAPGISSFTGKLEEMDGTARGGRNTMVLDLSRASPPVYTENEEPVLPEENVKFVFHFPKGEKLEAVNGLSNDPAVMESGKAIADKVAELCGNVHPKQLSNVYYALSQSGICSNVNCGFLAHGISSNEHMAVTFSLSRNDETGAVTIKYSEPKDFPVKFNWTVTVNVDGSSTSTPMRIDHGQYEAKAMTFVDQIAAKLPGKSEAAAKSFIKDVLAYCGDDFELKDVVSRTIRGLCITATATMRTHDEIKARIDAVRANLEEVRKAAAGNDRIEKAGINFLWGMNGKSVPPGLIGKMLKAASAEKPGEFSKLSATSTPQQITKAVIEMREAVENVMRNAYVQDYLEGADEMGPARAFAFSVLVAKFPEAQLKGVKDVFSSEAMSKLFTVMDDLMRDRRPAGAKPVSRNISSFIREQSMALEQVVLQYKKAVESLLGQEEDDGVRPFEGQFDKTAFGDKDIHDLLVPLAERDEAAELDAERRQEYMPRAFPRAQSNAVTAYAIAGEDKKEKVDKLIRVALSHCAASEEAVNYVAANIDRILVSGKGTLRTLEDVREISLAVVQRGVEGAEEILG